MIRYFYHDGSLYLVPHYTNASDLAAMINLARQAAVEAMAEAGAAHAVYAVKRYHPETGDLCEAEIYCPAVVLDDANFYKRTEAETKEHPGCYILAAHAHK